MMPEGDANLRFLAFLALNFLLWMWVTPKLDRWLPRSGL